MCGGSRGNCSIPIRNMQQSSPFIFGGTRLEVLAPDGDYVPDITPKNDDSLVMRVRIWIHIVPADRRYGEESGGAVVLRRFAEASRMY